jgi:S1-C subfamily serine protease
LRQKEQELGSPGKQKDAQADKTRIATIGFPGETQYFNYHYPVATLKSGSISALRPLQFPFSSDSTDRLIQYDFDLTGGTSGSPVFNEAGHVIAINYSGYDRGSINFGIRSDLLAWFSPDQPRTDFNEAVWL